jgi:Xaa-Pro dipeptidase
LIVTATPHLPDSLPNYRHAAQPITVAEHQHRIDQMQQQMARQGVDTLLLTAGASLRYLTGVDWHMLERFTGALLPANGDPVFLVPAFEAPRLRRKSPLDLPFLTWQEDESPYDKSAQLLRDWGHATGRLAIDEQAPYFVAHALGRAAPQLTLLSAESLVGQARMLKSPAEVALIQQAMQLTLHVHRLAAQQLRPGITNGEVVEFLHRAHLAGGSDGGSTFAIVAFGEETAYPHGPSGPQRLQEGDMVLIDTGCQLHGYHADLTRTYVFGNPTARQREVWEIEHAAQAAAFEAVRIGQPCGSIDDAARAVLQKHGYGPDYQTPGLPHRTGHGIGLEIHERPYFVRGNEQPLQPGMCGSIEPMLCLYGEVGVRLEDHFVIEESGPRWFTNPSRAVDDPFE